MSKIQPPTAAEQRLIDNVVQRLDSAGPQEIRVLCPRGHFIAHTAVYVQHELGGNPPIYVRPRGEGKEFTGDLSSGHHGFRMAFHAPSGSPNVRLECQHKKCSYSGQFNFSKLAVELAAYALSGNHEHRLTR